MPPGYMFTTHVMTTLHVKQCYYPNVDKEAALVTDLFRAAIGRERDLERGREHRRHHMREERISRCAPRPLFAVYGPQTSSRQPVSLAKITERELFHMLQGVCKLSTQITQRATFQAKN
jgi:hypothetical protein